MKQNNISTQKGRRVFSRRITLCMPVIGIIGLCGFYQKNGMTLVQLVRSSIRLILQKPYVYETCTTNELSEMEDLNDGSKRRKQGRNSGV